MSGLVFSPAAVAVSWALVHALWQGAAAAAVLRAALALIPAGNGQARYAAAAAALGVAVGLPVLTLLWLLRDVAPGAGFALSPAYGAAGAAGGAAAAVPRPGASGVDPVALALAAVPIAWAAAAAFALVRLGGGALRVRALVRSATPAPAAARSLLARLVGARGMRRPVRLLVSADFAGPAAVGGRSPAILLPEDALEALEPPELEAALLHELMHLSAGDDRWALLQAVLDAFLAPSPAARWISSRVREEREHRCDDLVVRHTGAPRYVRTLARLDELREPALARHRLALAADGAPLLARVRRLAAPGRRRPRNALAALVAGAILVLAGRALLAASAAALPETGPRMVIRAHDDAGAFTLALRGRRVIGATIGGKAVPATRVRVAGDSVHFLDDRGTFVVRLRPEGGLTWHSRPPLR